MTTAFHRLRLIWLCLAGLLCATSGSFASNRGHDSSGDGLLAAKTTPSGKLQPHPDASGSHMSFKVDPKTGKVTKYETYQPQPNPQNPSQWGFVKRVDTQYSPPHNHFNKATQTDVPTPHVHERTTAGGVRPALPDELPR